VLDGLLTPAAHAQLERDFPLAAYGWPEFDRDVHIALRRHFGAARVIPNNKCITVRGGSGTLDADVVVAIRAQHFAPPDQWTTEGMAFWSRTDGQNRRVVNYPKLHYGAGVVQNLLCGGRYKPAIRMFKNARNYMIERRLLAGGAAPSYFVEGLFYNVPHDKMIGTYDQIYFRDECSPTLLRCQNGVIPLFGTSPEQWNVAAAAAFVTALRDLWNNWR
jgi:hypothetical protein